MQFQVPVKIAKMPGQTEAVKDAAKEATKTEEEKNASGTDSGFFFSKLKIRFDRTFKQIYRVQWGSD